MAREKKVITPQIEEVSINEMQEELQEVIQEENQEEIQEKIKVKVINCTKLRIRKEPNLECDVVDLLSQDQIVEVEEDLGDFYKIENGFILKKFTEII
jgi:predicted nucleotide-binding protein (sugar kinase/HSP70/actin superfamily)